MENKETKNDNEEIKPRVTKEKKYIDVDTKRAQERTIAEQVQPKEVTREPANIEVQTAPKKPVVQQSKTRRPIPGCGCFSSPTDAPVVFYSCLD